MIVWIVKLVGYPEDEFYRFGPGARKASLFAAVLPASIGGQFLILRVRIVRGRDPLLLSHGALEELDVVYEARTGRWGCQS